MKLRNCFPVFALLTFMAPAWAAVNEPWPSAPPEEAGMSSVRLARVGKALQTEIDGGVIPGAVVAVVRKGRLVYFESFGYVDKTTGARMPKDAIFTIASMTKPLTVTGALMLYEEGRLLLNDPVGKYLPQLNNVVVATATGTEPVHRKPTIQDLMRHTAGFTYGNRGSGPLYKNYPQSSGESAETMTSDVFLATLGSLPLFYQPGTRWDYSFGMDLVGLTVEAVTKQKLGDYLRERLFGPLGMLDTGFVIPSEKLSRFAKPLPIDPQTGKPQAFRNPVNPNKFDCGGGCAYSTAMDYARFAEMLRNRGKFGDKQYLGRKTIEFMTSDQLGPEVNTEKLRDFPNMNGYGFGLSVAVRKGAGVPGIMGTPGDFNWGGANGTYFWVDPKEELTVVLMAAAPGEVRVHLRQLITALALQAIAD
jgi:CubicO group peptidase (beta-lactamase class C family)